MANSKLFQSAVQAPAATAVNSAGGKAYAFTAEHALAQAVATGTFADGFYSTAEEQLKRLKEDAAKCSDSFVAKAAIWGHKNGRMKDGPGALLAYLFGKQSVFTDVVFDRVVTNGRMLRNFVQMVRSGQFGRKSLGSKGKRLISNWINRQSVENLLNASVGNKPSLSDVLALAHVKPTTVERADFYKYLRGGSVDRKALPETVQQFEAFLAGETSTPPSVEFRLLTGKPLSKEQWTNIALNMPWNALRQNLNTLARHGVFETPHAVDYLAHKLESDVDGRAHPYSLFAAFQAVQGTGVPTRLQNALQVAAEKATVNVPSFDLRTAVIVDVSASMGSPVTGDRGSATSSMRCIDAAAFIAACIARKNAAQIIPVDTRVRHHGINTMDSIMTIAKNLAAFNGGGTALGEALRHLQAIQSDAEVIILVSDNESWADSGWGRGTTVTAEFQRHLKRVPHAKLVCIDLTPNRTTQARDSKNVLNIGGFSDNIFETIRDFVKGEARDWVTTIREVAL